MNWLRRLALAIGYITCIPVPANASASGDSALSGLSKYLPTVGLLIGLCLAALYLALVWQNTNSHLTAAILVLTWLWLTGALHMDGFMDTADGVFSHRPRERILEIMQDSRVGNFAVLAAISIIAIKIFALATLSLTQTLLVITLVPAWARLCEVYAIGQFEYARAQGKGKIWHDSTNFPKDLVKAAAPVVLATIAEVWFAGKVGLIAPVATVIGGVAVAHWLNAKVGGQTGDTYGAVVEAAETIGVLSAALIY